MDSGNKKKRPRTRKPAKSEHVFTSSKHGKKEIVKKTDFKKDPRKKEFGSSASSLKSPFSSKDLDSLKKGGVFSQEKVVEGKQDNSIRLNKYIASSGLCSRREADEYIRTGQISVNDTVISEMGVKVQPGDVVKCNGQRIKAERKVYVLLNKPKDYVTTMDDPEERKTVMDLVKDAGKERIYPVGRLDRNTTGVLLLTNDGDIASRLTHPKFDQKKIYHVFLDKDMRINDFRKLAAGIELSDGFIRPDGISYVNPDSKAELGIEIHSGKNRIVRRMLEAVGYKVTKLDRVYFAGLTKKNLPRGQWRYLNEKEINNLMMTRKHNA